MDQIIPQKEQTDNLPEQYGRVQGADWFPALYKKPMLILGQGGIGSHLSFMMSRLGCELHLFDDDFYEAHNMTGQLVKQSDIGKNKAVAMQDILAELSPDCQTSSNGRYTEDSYTGEIVLCGFDNMAARQLAFSKWKSYVESLSEEERKQCLFQDGRLLAEVMQILTIPGDRPDLIEKYEKDFLFPDSDVQEASCTFKQTSHCAAMIAAHMTGFVTNWAYNVMKGKEIRKVPFYYDYMIPLNMSTYEY